MADTRKHIYPGDLAALEAALLPGVAPGEVRALKPFSVLTSLVSQACHGDPAHAAGILDAAARHVAVLESAAKAAALVIADARAGLGLDAPAPAPEDPPADPPAPEAPADPPAPPAPKAPKGGKGS